MRTYSAIPGEWHIFTNTRDIDFALTHILLHLFTIQGTYGRRGEIGAIGLPGESGAPVGCKQIVHLQRSL